LLQGIAPPNPAIAGLTETLQVSVLASTPVRDTIPPLFESIAFDEVKLFITGFAGETKVIVFRGAVKLPSPDLPIASNLNL